MHSWKNTETRGALLVFAAMLAVGPPAAADGIVVEYASSELSGEQLMVDASLRFDFGAEIIGALEHGVELHIEVPIRVERVRDWLWDEPVAELRLRYTLQNHPLSEDYVVTEAHSGERLQFSTYEAALKHLGMISNHPVLAADRLDPAQRYRGRIRARLDLHALPVPLQPAAFASAAWRLESAWYEWQVR
jgi:hypothetical protein